MSRLKLKCAHEPDMAYATFDVLEGTFDIQADDGHSSTLVCLDLRGVALLIEAARAAQKEMTK